jgi:myosin-1
LSKKTWPNPKNGKAKDNVGVILKEFNYENDVRYGTTKVFIKKPETVFGLESKRTEKIPQIVVYLQKVKSFI